MDATEKTAVDRTIDAARAVRVGPDDTLVVHCDPAVVTTEAMHTVMEALRAIQCKGVLLLPAGFTGSVDAHHMGGTDPIAAAIDERVKRAEAAAEAALAELEHARKAQREHARVKPTTPLPALGQRLCVADLCDGLRVATQYDVENDCVDETTWVVVHGPVKGATQLWWLVRDGDSQALYPPKALIKDFFGSGKPLVDVDKVMTNRLSGKACTAPTTIPPMCPKKACGAYHHPGCNDGVCAY